MPIRTPVFVVSMKNADARRQIFADRAKNAGANWQFFEAHQSLAPEIEYDEYRAKIHRGRPLSPGELGCYSSHYSLWQQLLSSDCDQCIILEDDVIVDWPKLKQVADTNFTATGIPLLRFYQKAPCPFIVRHSSFLGRRSFLIELFDRPSGTQGYLITRSAAERLVRYCRIATRPIDEQLDRFWDHGLPLLCLFPFPVIEETVHSSIGDQRYANHQTSLKRKIYVRRDRVKRLAAIFVRRFRHVRWVPVGYG